MNKAIAIGIGIGVVIAVAVVGASVFSNILGKESGKLPVTNNIVPSGSNLTHGKNLSITLSDGVGVQAH